MECGGAGLLDASPNRAVFAPARARFPAIRCSNYGSAIHLALHGATEFLFWNPHPSPTARDPAPLSQPEDEILLDGILDDLNRRLGSGPRKPLTLEPVAWNARVIVSGLRVGDRVTWRFTFAPGAEPCEAMLDGKPVRLEPAAGEVGAWLTHAASQQLVLK
jgi:hypothetical protein